MNGDTGDRLTLYQIVLSSRFANLFDPRFAHFTPRDSVAPRSFLDRCALNPAWLSQIAHEPIWQAHHAMQWSNRYVGIGQIVLTRCGAILCVLGAAGAADRGVGEGGRSWASAGGWIVTIPTHDPANIFSNETTESVISSYQIKIKIFQCLSTRFCCIAILISTP